MNWLKGLFFIGFLSLICCSDQAEPEPMGPIRNCNLVIDSLACTTGIGDISLFSDPCILQEDNRTTIKFQDEEFELNDMGTWGPLGHLGYTQVFLELDTELLHLRFEDRGITTFEWCDIYWSGI